MQEIRQQKRAPATKRPPPERESSWCDKLILKNGYKDWITSRNPQNNDNQEPRTYDTNVDNTPAAVTLSSPDKDVDKVFHPGRLQKKQKLKVKFENQNPKTHLANTSSSCLITDAMTAALVLADTRLHDQNRLEGE